MTKSILELKLTQKALNFRFGINQEQFIDSMLEQDPDGKKWKTKNVCAHMSEPLVQRLENTLAMLEMSKREFITLAIVEALDKADKAISDYAFDETVESHTAFVEAKREQQGAA